MGNSRRTSGHIEAKTWFLATEICQEAKPDFDQWQELFPRIYGLLIQRWQNECENCTDLEKEEWKVSVRRKYLDFAKASREQDWKRLLFYKRCKYLRYIIMLAGSTMVAYLCSQETIFILFSDSLRVRNGWYYCSTFIALAAVPVSLTVIATGRNWASHLIVQQFVAATLVLGYTTPIILFFSTLIFQWSVGTFDLIDLVAGLVSILFCLGGLVTGFVEVFPSGKRRRVHPLQDILFNQAKPEDTGSVRRQVEQKLIQVSFDVCKATHMDDDADRNRFAENLYVSLFARWTEYLQESNDPWDTLNVVLKKFAPVANAANKEPWWMRVLFYKRHETTRYLAIIGTALTVLYVLLLAINVPTKTGHGRWGLWDLNILNGGMIASCIAVARLSWPNKIRLVGVLFGFGALWGIARVSGDAFMAVATIHDYWPDGWAFWGLLSITPALCVIIAILLVFAVGQSFFPLPTWIVARVHRWVSRF